MGDTFAIVSQCPRLVFEIVLTIIRINQSEYQFEFVKFFIDKIRKTYAAVCNPPLATMTQVYGFRCKNICTKCAIVVPAKRHANRNAAGRLGHMGGHMLSGLLIAGATIWATYFMQDFVPAWREIVGGF